MSRFILGVILFSLSSLVMEAHEEKCGGIFQPCRAALRHIESGGIGYKEGYTTLEMFFSSDKNSWEITPFIDVRGHVFNNGEWASNVGGGLRAIFGERIYGINGYYDYRNGSHLHSSQIGLGLETLGERVDFRLNGYLPVGKKTSAPYHTAFDSFSGNFLFLLQKYQSAMKGANAELGMHCGKSWLFDWYTALGPYYFIGEGTSSTFGGKARVTATFKECVTLELSDSYDKTFHNKFQAQISLGFPFGPSSERRGKSCGGSSYLNNRRLQAVAREEIIIMDTAKKKTVAIDPLTAQPYFFLFVDNTSNSEGTYESPYHSLAQVEEVSAPNNIIYVFPGDGTTMGMDSGIALKPNQKFWGSGKSHILVTSQGTISIPAESSVFPVITNTNIDTEGNALTLSTDNAISGIRFSSAMNDAIYGENAQGVEISSCVFENTTTYPIEVVFPENASFSLINNEFENNVNGVFASFNGTSTFICSNNTFNDQSSVSSFPVEIAANNNTLVASIDNNIFNSNTTGSVRFNFTDVVDANISLVNNTVTNNGTGSQASLGSSFAFLTNGTTENCVLLVRGNLFSGNASNSVYLHTSGAFTALDITASANTLSNNGGSALVLATPVNHLTMKVTDNTLTGCNDNGIAVISSGLSSTGTITIANNTLTNIGNASNGIAINQDFSSLTLTVMNNTISGCEGTGIVSYAPTGIQSLTLNISNNIISNCQNLSSNAASGIDIEQYVNMEASIANNTLSGNTGLDVVVGSTLPSPSVCLNLTGNSSSSGYLLTNPGDGLFNLSPCNAAENNTGTINLVGDITSVQSCSELTSCSF